MPNAPRRTAHPYLPPAPRADNPRHSLRRGLVRFWAPVLDPGRNRLVHTLGQYSGIEAPFTGPTWTTSNLGAGIAFNGTGNAVISSDARGLFDGGTGSGSWDFSTSAMTFDNASYAFDGTGPGAGTGQSAVTIAVLGVLTAIPSSAGVLYGQSRSDNANALLSVQVGPGGSGTWDFSSAGMTFDNAAYDFSGAAPGGGGSLSIAFKTAASNSVSASVAAPAAGVPFLFIGRISDGATAGAYLLDLSNRAKTSGTTTSGNASFAGITLLQETHGASYAGGSAGSFAPFLEHAVAVWDRALSDAEIQDFQEDPYILFRQPLEDTWVQTPGSTAPGQTLTTAWTLAAGVATASSVAPGTTLTTQWSLAGGQATASSVAPGTTLTTNWSLIPLGQVGGQLLTTQWSLSTVGTAQASSQTPSGTTLTTNWFLSPGGAIGLPVNPGTAPGALLITNWSLFPGGANGPAGGALLTTNWSLFPGGATSYNPYVPGQGRNGGGGWGPTVSGSGLGKDELPEVRERRRKTLASHLERVMDPEGYERRQAEAKAAAEKAAAAEEEQRTRPERIGRSVLRALNLTDWD